MCKIPGIRQTDFQPWKPKPNQDTASVLAVLAAVLYLGQMEKSVSNKVSLHRPVVFHHRFITMLLVPTASSLPSADRGGGGSEPPKASLRETPRRSQQQFIGTQSLYQAKVLLTLSDASGCPVESWNQKMRSRIRTKIYYPKVVLTHNINIRRPISLPKIQSPREI